jgi:chemotaxis protein CheD
MYDHRITGYSQAVTIIHPGEYLATGDDIIIATVLGSCVAVALKDEKASIGGLNHFMLPGMGLKELKGPDLYASDPAKYGMYAMELLINEMLKMGCKKERLVAKVFGGGSVLALGPGNQNTVPQSNIDFAFQFLKTEGIPVLAQDVGGTHARKILFFTRDGKVLLKRITGTLIAAVKQEERSYIDRILRKEKSAGDITLFDS